MFRLLFLIGSFYFVHATFEHIIGNLKWNTAIQENTVFKELLPVSLVQCAKECLSRQGTCMSFNYIRTVLLCQISASEDRNLVQDRDSFVHSLISTWPKELIGNCSDVVCSKGRHCDENDSLCKISECDIIPTFDGMKTRNFDRSVGYGVLYECTDEKYVPSGDMTIVCREDGTWSSMEGKCILGYCGDIPRVENSIIKSGYSKIGSVREYSCDKYYFMTGSPTITCLEIGSWTSSNFECHERCPVSKGFTYSEEKDVCFKILNVEGTHEQAYDMCGAENSTLITIKSKATQDLIGFELTKGYHIDARFDSVSNTWIDKDGQELTYTNGQSLSPSSGSCVGVFQSTWITIPCSTPGLPVCEYGKCPSSYIFYPKLNLCYKIYDTVKRNRTDAQIVCKQKGGHLLFIDDEYVQSYIETVDNTQKEIFVPKNNQLAYSLLTDYGYNVGTSTSIKLKFKACNDVHVALMSENKKNNYINFYEIVIGGWGNRKSVLRKQKQKNAVATYNGKVLDCNVFKTYVVSWKDNTIQLSNDFGLQLFSYIDPNPYSVKYVGVSGGSWAHVTFMFVVEELYWITGWYEGGVWRDYKDRNMKFTKWYTGRPDQIAGPSGITLKKSTSIGDEFWFDSNPSVECFFICEYP